MELSELNEQERIALVAVMRLCGPADPEAAEAVAEDAAVRAIAAGCDALLVCVDPDSQERVRRALAARARVDEAFAARLRDAHDRVVRIRRRAPPSPAADDRALFEVLRCPEHLAVLEEIRERLADR